MIFLVEGSNHSNVTAISSDSAISLNTAGPSTPRPLFHARKSSSTANVKIIKAKMKRNSSGKAEFNFISQIFVGVTDATANVGYISNEIQKIWSHEYDLVTNDGLPIIDCPGTQGIFY